MFLKPFQAKSLKPLGHATVVEFVEKNFADPAKIYRVLEIGHGSTGPFSQLFDDSTRIKRFGIDDNDKDKTVSVDSLNQLRNRYQNTTFYSGYLGDSSSQVLQFDSFDLVFSVSLIEHIPKGSLMTFHQDLHRILKPGGLQIHSYDRAWGSDVKIRKEVIDNNGFEWLEKPQKDINDFWSLSTIELARTAFEHPYNVMEKFSHAQPREGRLLYDWVTVITAARKV
ncbi:class I SAM-dependent methyltransferase [Synechococcus sp. AH-736-G21]|nr:class I SAM-dependent methyltransferase [Synechococcus sp. AH-736-G21]